MIEQTIYWYPMEEYGLPTGTNSREIWMVFKNISSINLRNTKLNVTISATIGIFLTVMK